MGFCHLLETEGSRNDVLHKPRAQLGTEMSMKSLSYVHEKSKQEENRVKLSCGS